MDLLDLLETKFRKMASFEWGSILGTVKNYLPPDNTTQSPGKHKGWRLALWITVVAVLVLLVVGEVMLRRAAPILKGRMIETLSTRFDSRVELDDLQVSLIKGLAVTGKGLRIFAPDDVVAAVNGILPAARDAKIEIHLETALGPAEFASILERLSDPLVRVNYDSGNSASLGYDVRAEFAAYGSRVGSVHIKDRVRGGGTVPLGSGDADLPALAECLGKIRYDRDLILQVARGVPGGEMHWMKKNRQYVADLFKDLPSEARL